MEVRKVKGSQRKRNHSVGLEYRIEEGGSGKHRQKRSIEVGTMQSLEYQVESIMKCSCWSHK